MANTMGSVPFEARLVLNSWRVALPLSPAVPGCTMTMLSLSPVSCTEKKGRIGRSRIPKRPVQPFQSKSD